MLVSVVWLAGLWRLGAWRDHPRREHSWWEHSGRQRRCRYNSEEYGPDVSRAGRYPEVVRAFPRQLEAIQGDGLWHENWRPRLGPGRVPNIHLPFDLHAYGVPILVNQFDGDRDVF